MKIVLIGYMGSGKSTIGRLLAGRIVYGFTDLDSYIEDREGMTVPQIFDRKGAIYFRRKEAQYLQELLSDNDRILLALGGGTPCYGDNMERILKMTDRVFYLKLSVKALADRLGGEKKERPLIANIERDDLPEFIGKHLLERNTFYQKAHYTIDCEGKPTDAIVSEIEEKLGADSTE